MRIYVGGINGVGKTTVLRRAAEVLDYKYIHATSGLMAYCGFPGDYQKLRALTQHERNEKLAEYVRQLLADNQYSNLLFDAHYQGLVRGEVNRVTSYWMMLFDALVLVTAPLDEVWSRIATDAKTRDRALFPARLSTAEQKSMLFEYQTSTLAEFKRLANLYHKPSLVVENRQGELDEAVSALVQFVRA